MTIARHNIGLTQTPEQRATALQKAREARARKVKADVRNDYADMPYWEQLAKDAGMRLPPPGTAITHLLMKRWFRKIGIKAADDFRWSGERAFNDFTENNPRWSMRAFGGICLEHKDLILSLRN